MEELFQVTHVTRIVVVDSHRYWPTLRIFGVASPNNPLRGILKAVLCARPIHPKFKQQDDVWKNIILLLDDWATDFNAIPDAPVVEGVHHHPTRPDIFL